MRPLAGQRGRRKPRWPTAQGRRPPPEPEEPVTPETVGLCAYFGDQRGDLGREVDMHLTTAQGTDLGQVDSQPPP